MTPTDNFINTQPDPDSSEHINNDLPPFIHHRLTGDFLLTIQMIPAAVIFGWFMLPANMFRVITGAEPSESIVWPLIIAYWLILIPLSLHTSGPNGASFS